MDLEFERTVVEAADRHPEEQQRAEEPAVNVKTQLKAGGYAMNHSESLVVGAAGRR